MRKRKEIAVLCAACSSAATRAWSGYGKNVARRRGRAKNEKIHTESVLEHAAHRLVIRTQDFEHKPHAHARCVGIILLRQRLEQLVDQHVHVVREFVLAAQKSEHLKSTAWGRQNENENRAVQIQLVE